MNNARDARDGAVLEEKRLEKAFRRDFKDAAEFYADIFALYRRRKNPPRPTEAEQCERARTLRRSSVASKVRRRSCT